MYRFKGIGYLTVTLALFTSTTIVHSYEHDVNWVAKHLSTRSPYPSEQVPQYDTITDDYILDQLQLVSRHGTRYPEADTMEDINNILGRLSKSNNKTALAWLPTYKNIYTMSREGMLDSTGQQEQYLHGRRVAQSYPGLVDSVLDNDVQHISAYSSWSLRTSQSGTAFLMGMFEGRGHLGSANMFSVPILSYGQQNDTIIAFHESCPRWLRDVSKSPTLKDTMKKWRESMLRPITDRLSKDLGMPLTASDVKKLHNGCAYDVAQRKDTSTFCSLFSQEDLLRIEYFDDIKVYYKYAYGQEDVNSKLACRLGQTLAEDMDAAVRNTTDHYRLTVKFGHSETIVPLFTFLGLHHDDFTLVPTSTPENIEHRKFRCAQFATFSGNIAFQLLTKKGTTDKYVRVLVAEQPVVVPGCESSVCPYAQFAAAMKERLTCNFDTICT